jgi:hypothetical protein
MGGQARDTSRRVSDRDWRCLSAAGSWVLLYELALIGASRRGRAVLGHRSDGDRGIAAMAIPLDLRLVSDGRVFSVTPQLRLAVPNQASCHNKAAAPVIVVPSSGMVRSRVGWEQHAGAGRVR